MTQCKSMTFVSVSVVLLSMLVFGSRLSAAAPMMQFGFSKVDVTPDRPIRLSGYGGRKTPYAGIAQKLWARAMAMQQTGDTQTTCVLISVDSINVPKALTTRIARQLATNHGVSRDRFVLCSTHSHSAPELDGMLSNHFKIPLSAEEQAEIKRYTSRLEERIIKAVAAAIEVVVDSSMISYNLPGRFSQGTEDVLIRRVHELSKNRRLAPLR